MSCPLLSAILCFSDAVKVLFLGFSALTVYWIGWRYNKASCSLLFLLHSLFLILSRQGYDKEHDTFRLVFVLAPAAVLAVVTPKPDPYSVVDTLWTASIYLEAVAILPQLFLVRRTGEVENLTSNYIAAMGAYRFFYILNWIFRYYTEPEYYGIPGNFVVWIGGLVQTALYAGPFLSAFFSPLLTLSLSDFFYYFFRSKWHGQKFTLPGATDV